MYSNFFYFSPELMQEVVSSPDLFVIQVEMDIYAMLKKVPNAIKCLLENKLHRVIYKIKST